MCELRRLSVTCDFENNLDSSLRDRLVCGIKDDGIQRRLLAEKTLNNGRNGSFNVAGYLIEERRRWPVITASLEDNVLNKFRIWKERHVQVRKPYQSPGSDDKLILLYCPGRGSNSRPPAHRSFEHGQGVPRP